MLVDSFAKAGWQAAPPPATMFAWIPIPQKYRSTGSLEFSKLPIEQAQIAVSPGIGFGEYGDEHVRIAIVENQQRIRQAVKKPETFSCQRQRKCAKRRTNFGTPKSAIIVIGSRVRSRQTKLHFQIYGYNQHE